jgi:hypothetical protein
MRSLVAIALGLLAACGGGSPAGRSVVSNGGTYTVTFETTPATIPMNEPFTVVFKVASKSGDSVEGARLEIDARMPAHGHGMNRAPKLSKTPDGSTRADGMLFHMPGHWEMYFDITQGGRSERAQVDVDLK